MIGEPNTTIPEVILNRYRIESELGGGGLGVVYRMYDLRLKRSVAVKTLKPGVSSTTDEASSLRERFASEAEAGARITSHPNVVGVIDFVTDSQGVQYLIQEYIPGGTLAGRLKREGALPMADVLRLTIDIARGLQAAHDAGLVHRDVKPANIFLASDGRALVGDFGIAQIDDRSHRTRVSYSHPGTPLYMSPEQSRSLGYLTPATDQYSLGLMVFEMLTGKAYKPLGQRRAEEMLAQLPLSLATLVTRMIAENPDDRYPSMEAVIAAVTAIAATLANSDWEPTAASPPGTPAIPAAAPSPRTTPLINLSPVPHTVALQETPTRSQSPSRPSVTRILVFGIVGLLVVGVAGTGIFTRITQNGSRSTLATQSPDIVNMIAPVLTQTAVPSGMVAALTANTPTPAVSATLPAITPQISPPMTVVTTSSVAVATVTATPMPAPTRTPAPLPTNTPLPAPTNTPAPVPTNTPLPAPTSTAVPAPTDTPVPPAPTQLPLPPMMATPAPMPTTAAPEPPSMLAVFSAGTIGHDTDYVSAADVIRTFNAGSDVWGFVNYGGAMPDNDILIATLTKDGITGAPLPLTLSQPDGFVTFPLGQLAVGDYRIVIHYHDADVKDWSFSVITPPTSTPVPYSAPPRANTVSAPQPTYAPNSVPARPPAVVTQPTYPPAVVTQPTSPPYIAPTRAPQVAPALPTAAAPAPARGIPTVAPPPRSA